MESEKQKGNSALIAQIEADIAETRKRAWEDGPSCDTGEGTGRDDLKALSFEKILRSLVLREEELHGELGPTPEYLQSEIEQRNKRFLELTTEAQGAANQVLAEARAWRFAWRRAAAYVCGGGLAAVVCFESGVLSLGSATALLLFTTLLILGPWDLAARARTVAGFLNSHRECRALRTVIRRLEKQLEEARLRSLKAAHWIESREKLLRAEYEIQFSRAARAAARIRNSQQVDKPTATGGGHRDAVQKLAIR